QHWAVALIAVPSRSLLFFLLGMLPALLGSVSVRNELDRAALAVHSTMLEHGFVCVGTASGSSAPVLNVAQDGSVSMQVVPPGWNSFNDSYAFGYLHPLRGAEETFVVKALAVGNNLAVHAESSSPGADLLSVILTVDQEHIDGDPSAVAARAKDWQERIAAEVTQRLLGRNSSTARLGAALQAAPAQAGGNKRRVVEDPSTEPERRSERPERDHPERSFVPPVGDPFRPDFFPDDRRMWWLPDGGLLGPRHPAWGQVMPGRSGGMMPRFDPIGPGEPDPDHLPLPGRGGPGGLPTFIDRPPGRGSGLDPDGIFFM
ncbi:Probable proteasome inhibitor, partial [Durusdinium trenchii]